MVDDIRIREIENILISAMGKGPVWRLKHPLRMLPEKFRISADHFRLDPQTEFHAKLFDLSGKARDPFRQFCPIREPVAKRRRIVVPSFIPSVIEHEQFDPEVFCLLCHFEDRFFIEIHIGSFPVVDQDRPDVIAPPAPCKTLPEQGMKGLAHRVRS